MLTPADLVKKVGAKVLFIGIESYSWQLTDYVKAAQNARTMGFDTIAPKIADGTIRWYKSKTDLIAIRNAVLAQGCGFLPFTYLYGPRFNDDQIRAEAALAKEIASVCDGLCCLDMEVEWNGKVDAAKLLAKELSGTAYDFILTTWADPVQQNWMDVLKELDSVVSAWGPQQYTVWLVTQEDQFKTAGINTSKIFPALDVADTYIGVDPLLCMTTAIARGHKSIWVWEYQACLANPNLIKAMLFLMPRSEPIVVNPTPVSAPAPAPTVSPAPVNDHPVVKPVVPPHPDHGTNVVYGSYTIKDGDSLSGIADRLNIRNWFADLYLPNKTVLDSKARAHGAPDCEGGNLIYAGTVLKYPILK